jgi:hypothetical protein
MIVSAQSNSVIIWNVNAEKKSISSEKINMGNLKRDFSSIVLDEDDKYAYAGTKTGDVIFIDMNTKRFI